MNGEPDPRYTYCRPDLEEFLGPGRWERFLQCLNTLEAYNAYARKGTLNSFLSRTNPDILDLITILERLRKSLGT